MLLRQRHHRYCQQVPGSKDPELVNVKLHRNRGLPRCVTDSCPDSRDACHHNHTWSRQCDHAMDVGTYIMNMGKGTSNREHE